MQKTLALAIGRGLERRPLVQTMPGALGSLGSLLFPAIALPLAIDAHGARLPYDTRTRTYSGHTSTVRGDVRAVAMAGATVGNADSALATRDNPSGLAMGFEGVDISLVTNYVRDGYLASYSRPNYNNGLGAAFNLYPWGVSFGYFGRVAEDDVFELDRLGGRSQRLSIGYQDFSLAAARVFWDHRLAFGIQFDFGQSVIRIEDPTSGLNQQWLGNGFGATLGLSFQFRPKWLLGISYSSPRYFDGGSAAVQPTALPGFFQSIEIPFRLATGVGWRPNRFTGIDFTLSLVGATPNAATLRDQAVGLGNSYQLVPRLGLSYRVVDFPEMDATLFGGSYLETPYVQGTPTRVHGTLGTRGRIWVILFGAGIDASAEYSNALFYVGLDIFRVIQKFGFVPELRMGAYGGLLPAPFRARDKGMPRPLTINYVEPAPHERPPEAVKVMEEIPTRLGNTLDDWSEEPSKIPARLLRKIGEIPTKLGEEFDRMKQIQENTD